MASNDYIAFHDCQDEPWVDPGGMYRLQAQPCVSCGDRTHRWDTLAEGPVCNDGTEESCSEILWRLHHRVWGLEALLEDG